MSWIDEISWSFEEGVYDEEDFDVHDEEDDEDEIEEDDEDEIEDKNLKHEEK